MRIRKNPIFKQVIMSLLMIVTLASYMTTFAISGTIAVPDVTLAGNDTKEDLNVILQRESGTDVNEYKITGTSNSKNYKVTVMPAIYKINPKTLTEADVEVLNPTGAVYNTNAYEVTVTVDANIANYTVKYYQGNTEVTTPINAGTYTAKVEFIGKGNYTGTVTITTDEYTIAKADQTLSLKLFDRDANEINIDETELPNIETSGNKVGTATFTANNNVVTIDSTTGEITALNETGTTIITVNYSGDNNYNEVSQTIELTIVDTTKPIIELAEKTQTLQANKGGEYTKVSYTVRDNYNNTEGLEVTTSAIDMGQVGTHIVTYTVTDRSGNSSSDTVTVNIIDTEAPIIKFASQEQQEEYETYGTVTVRFRRGGTYTKPEFTTSDNANGDITVKRSGIIDSSTPGTYNVKYTAKDAQGNSSEPVSVKVVVQNYDPIICYVYNGSKKVLGSSTEATMPLYAMSLELSFSGTGTLTNLDTDAVTENLSSGIVISEDARYKLTVELDDGAKSTVYFEINKKGPEIKVVHEDNTTETLENYKVYYGPVTLDLNIEFTDIASIRLCNAATGVTISNSPVEITEDIVFNETGLNRYSIRVEDKLGRYTDIVEFWVYIAE